MKQATCLSNMFPKGTDKVGQKVKPHNRFIAFFNIKKNCIKSKGGFLEKNKLCVICGAVRWVHHTCFDMGRSKGQAA